MPRFHKKKWRGLEIDPDEILLDAEKSDDSLENSQFEGRLERPLSHATYITIPLVLFFCLFVLLLRAGELEILDGRAFAAQSAENSLTSTVLFAPRGLITDEHGVVLAGNAQAADGSVRRVYPHPELGQIIGYVSYPKKDSSGNYYDTDEKGVVGLEAEYNDLLTGKNGEKLVETDALGNVRSEGSIVPAVAGKTLVLSIDADLEQKLANAIASVATQSGFVAGAGVILDVHTGAVRAIVSFPSYDPNVMSDGSPAATIAAYNTSQGHPFLDHAIAGVYTPGSIVKPFVASGALTDGVITTSTVIDDPGSISVPDPYHPGQSFRYTGWKALGLLDVKKAIAWSSDIFFYTVGGGFGNQKGLGIDRLDYWYNAFGIGKLTGIDIPGEVAGTVPSPAWKEATFNEPWYLGDTYFTAIGQYSMQVTPIQMARATAAIANGGMLVTPTLLNNVSLAQTPVPVSKDALAVVSDGMREGVTSALATAINLPYLAVAAKTGTAQVGANNQYDNSWVEGFFPYDNPQYAFAVVLERGPSGAGEDAVNVMRALFESLHAENSVYAGGTGVATSSLLAP